tara:strand:+ start:7657 stop:7899 length:243 start_codon:yes stop_codon:yes gene_type:complete
MSLKPRRETVKKERPQGEGLFFGKKFVCPPHDESIIYHIIAETDKLVLIEWTDGSGHKQDTTYIIEAATDNFNSCAWKLI